MRDTESSVEERPKFEIDLRVEIAPQDAIEKDEKADEGNQQNVREVEKRFMYKIPFVMT